MPGDADDRRSQQGRPASGSLPLGWAPRALRLDPLSRQALIRSGLVWLALDQALFTLLAGLDSGALAPRVPAPRLASAHLFSFAISWALLSPWWCEHMLARFGAKGARGHGLARLGITLLSFSMLLLSGGVLAFAVEIVGWPESLAALLAATVAIAGSLGGAVAIIDAVCDDSIPVARRWAIIAWLLVAFLVGLRAVYFPVQSLLPDEAYFWEAARHLDLGYVDYPPLVPWSVWLSTHVFGRNEFGMRLPAFLAWLAAAGFIARFTRNLFGATAAVSAWLLFAALPIFFATGMLITTDILSITAWAALLLFCERALLADRSQAWWGIGVALGLGLMSKYTVVLVGPAIVLFVLLDRRARRWLLRPEPYAALLVSLALFAPVLIWNHQHDWVSFHFQSTRRFAIPSEFSLHWLLLHVAILLTPVGLVAFALALVRPLRLASASRHDARRLRLFVWIFTLVPLAPFVVFGLTHYPRFHWTGPIWLAVLPLVAAAMTPRGDNGSGRGVAVGIYSAVLLGFVYAIGFYFLAIGLPGVSFPKLASYHFWREATPVVAEIRRETADRFGEPPVVVGMTKWSITSALDFYDREGDLGRIGSRHYFACSASMFETWIDPETATNRPLLLIAQRASLLEAPWIDSRLEGAEPTQVVEVERLGVRLRPIHFRIARRYLGLNSPQGINPPLFECGTTAAGPGSSRASSGSEGDGQPGE